MLKLFRKSKSRTSIAIDVGSHSIKGVILETGGVMPRIIAKQVVNLPLFYNPKEESIALKRLVIKTRKLLLDLTQMAENIPERALIAVSSGPAVISIKKWCAGRDEAVRTMTRNNAKNLFEKIKNKNAGANTFAYPLECTLNESPLRAGKIRIPKNARLCFRTLLLAFPEEVASIFTETQKMLGGVRVEIIPLALAEYYAAVSALKIQNALLVDVGGEKTDLIHIKDGALTQISSFPLGGRHFIRGIAKAADVGPEEAEDLKRQYVQGIVSERRKVLLRDFLRRETKLWEDAFSKKLARFYAPAGAPPPQIFLCGGGAHLTEINSVIRNGDWIKSSPYTESPRVNILRADTLFGGNSLGGNLQGPEEFGLSALVFYLLKSKQV